MKKQIIKIGLIVLLIIGLSGCTEIEIPSELSELMQFSITYFKVEPSIIHQGETANLSWMVIAGSTVFISNDVGNVSLTGNRIITPNETTIYILTAKNSTKTLTATTQIIVINETGEIGDNIPPVASFNYMPLDMITNQIVTFTDTSYDTDGMIKSWLWDFGDGTFTGVQNPTHTYFVAGQYAVTLTITDNDGLIDTYGPVIFTVKEKPMNIAPTALFTYVSTNLSVVFIDASTDPNTDDILTWSWNFGDDSDLNTTQNPTYEYAAAGTYNVTLTVTDSYGLTDDYTEEITVTT